MAEYNCKWCGATTRLTCRLCRECFNILEAFRKVRAKASHLVNGAVRAGKLPKPALADCVDCGVQAEVYEHRDYDFPLDVVPVCHGCNMRRGSAKQHPFRGSDAKRPTIIWAE